MTISEEEIFRCLFKESHDGILISSPDGTVLSCNKSMAQAVGLAESEIVGKPLSTFIAMDLPEKRNSESGIGDCTAIDTVDGGVNGDGGSNAQSTKVQTPTVNGQILSRSGTHLTMPVSHFPIQNATGETIGLATIAYIVQANSVQQAQTEFVSTVSHELRTPLTSIKGFADTILRAGDRIESGQQRRYIGIIKDQADRLTRLVEDLLAVSRLESKKMQLTIRAIDFAETLQRVIRNLSDKARSHRIVTHLAVGLPPVWADADRLEQILTNLIDNAIKYSPAQTTVTIAARDIDTSPEMVEFSVSDEGAGIPAEHIPKIFNKFSRLDNPLVRQTEGTGLGLYITRSLVLALKGNIDVISTPGKTTFRVQLPAASLEEQAARGRD